MNADVLKIANKIKANYPLLTVRTFEQDRFLVELAELTNGNGDETDPMKKWKIVTWDLTSGFRLKGKPVKFTPQGIQTIPEAKHNDEDMGPALEPEEQALKALQEATEGPPFIVYCFKNITWFLNNLRIIQHLMNCQITLKEKKSPFLFLTTPGWHEVPTELSREIYLLNHDLPSRTELARVFNRFQQKPENEEHQEKLLDSAMGMTMTQFEDAIADCLVETKGQLVPKVIYQIKTNIIERTAGLVFSQYTESFDNLIGLKHPKAWALDRFSKFRKLNLPLKGMIMTGLPGNGKCLGKGTPVLKYDGTIVPVEEIQTGDELMGPDSKPRKVLGTTKGTSPLYKVTPIKGDAYIVNEPHILSLKKTGTDEIKNMDIKAFLHLRKTKKATSERLKGWRSGVDWPKQEVPINPYILGLWLGNGDSRYAHFHNADEEVVSQLKEYADHNELILQKDTPSPNAKPNKSRRYRLVTKIGAGGAGKNKFTNALLALNLILNKHVPQVYLSNDRETRLQLLAGLIDTDGHLNTGAYGIITKYPALKDGILFLARSLGFAAYSSKKRIMYAGEERLYYRVRISGDISQIPVNIPRKKANPRKQIKDVLKTGIQVEAIGNGEYFGFELDSDHLFLLGDFTVTHNTHFARALANEVGWPCVTVNLMEVLDKYVGESPKKFRELWAVLRALAPVVAIFDEVEKTMGGVGTESSTNVYKEIGSIFLTEMDKYDPEKPVFVVCTSNDLSQLPPEYLRLGRFDALFFVDNPRPDDARQVLNMYLKEYWKKEAPANLDISRLKDYSGAELRQIAIEAAYRDNLDEALKFVVPIAQVRRERYSEIRRIAQESAAYPADDYTAGIIPSAKKSIESGGMDEFIRKVDL